MSAFKVNKETPLDALDIIIALEELLKPVLSPRQPFANIKQSITALSTEEQLFTLQWAKVIAASNIELAFVFGANFAKANKALNKKTLNSWLSNSLAIYDQEGLYPAARALKEIEVFKQRFIKDTYTCHLFEVKPLLDRFIQGLSGRLSGRQLSIKENIAIFTDTKHVYLPKTLSVYSNKDKNRLLYKSMACFLWAQTWYGTFKRKNHRSNTTQQKLDAYAQAERAKRIFLTLENIRLLANIQRDLPGLYREINNLAPLLIPQDNTWKMIAKKLSKKNSTVMDTFAMLDILIRLQIDLPSVDYQGGLNLLAVEQESIARKDEITFKINEIRNNLNQKEIEAFVSKIKEEKSAEENSKAEASYDENKSTETNEQLSELIRALLQDVDEIQAGDLSSEAQANAEPQQKNLEQAEKEPLLPAGFIELDEWDYLRQSYRKNWCQVYVKDVEEKENDFKQTTLDNYPYLYKKIRRVFEIMRDQPELMNKQTDGDDIDIDAVVEMITAKKVGEELSERIYIRRAGQRRSVAVFLLVDMSGSTKGWINQTMRESLILFSEALNIIGDQYAIYGFSGLTRQRCELYRIKDFIDNRPSKTAARIGNIRAKDYTRMGVAVRFASKQLSKVESKHRLLIILSDGKPDDYDGYQGNYGVQDTRKAILEAQGLGLKPFSITIDKQAQSYLPQLFGPGQYTILDEAGRLPLKLTEAYQKLSSQ